MEGVVDRMNRWESWGTTITQNVEGISNKMALLTKDFETIVNDVRSVDAKTQTNAQQMQQINNDLTVIKTDLGHIGMGMAQADSNMHDINTLQDFVGIRNYRSLDDVMKALGYMKGSLSGEQIAAMGFMNFNNITNYDFDEARFSSFMGRKSLAQFAAWVREFGSGHETRIKGLEGSLGDLQSYTDRWQENSNLIQNDHTTQVKRLRGYTGVDSYTTLEDYIGALGFTKYIESTGGMITAATVKNWGFMTTEGFRRENLGLSKFTWPDGQFFSINDGFAALLSNLGIHEGMIKDRITKGSLFKQELMNRAGDRTQRLDDWLDDVEGLGGIKKCLHGNTALKGLVESMETQFADMMDRFDKIVSDFKAFPDSLEQLLSEADKNLTMGVSARTAFKAFRQEFKALVAGGKSSYSGYGSGVPTVHGNKSYDGIKPSFEKMRDDLSSLKGKVTDLKKCGADNLNW